MTERFYMESNRKLTQNCQIVY